MLAAKRPEWWKSRGKSYLQILLAILTSSPSGGPGGSLSKDLGQTSKPFALWALANQEGNQKAQGEALEANPQSDGHITRSLKG